MPIFYGIPILTPLARVLALSLVINAFGVIQATLLTKRLNFKVQTKVSVIAGVLSGSIGIAMAYRGYGVWSLVAQFISDSFFRTALLWFFLPWRPSWIFSWASLRSMFPFGSKLLFSGLLDTIYNNLYLVVIGKMFSATQLGYYSRADQTVSFPARNLSLPVGRVAFPVFSSMQDDKVGLKRGTRKALSIMAMVNFPVMIGLAIVAKPLVIVLLTEKWLPCVPYIKLICVYYMLYPYHVINLNVLMAQGRSDLFFRLEIYKKVLITAAILLTAPLGILAMLWGQIVSSIVAFFINSYYTGKLISYSSLEQIYDFLPVLSVASIMGFGVLIAGYLPLKNVLGILLFQISIGIALYVSLCSLTKISSFVELRSIALDKYHSLFHRGGTYPPN